jgi:type VI secretion system protein ImpB
MASTQHLLDKVRPPRVQITYDVETGGAAQAYELPFALASWEGSRASLPF